MIIFATCCFIGHRVIEYTIELEQKLREYIEYLILNKNVGCFLFGSRSKFDELCLKIVTELKIKYPYIKRIYVRAEFQNIDKSYEEYLLKSYDETFFPKQIQNAGKFSYVERNQIMIDKSDYCVFYYKENYIPPTKKANKRGLFNKCNSGTKLALDYAKQKKKEIVIINKNNV
ncbi:MAG: hypothetical protein IJ358_01905 [Clostridia bacterium]|nr:hypothetical protein [Clostridia bacterium]